MCAYCDSATILAHLRDMEANGSEHDDIIEGLLMALTVFGGDAVMIENMEVH